MYYFIILILVFIILYFIKIKYYSCNINNQLTSNNADIFVLSCMDFRLLDDIVNFMNSKCHTNNYDQYISAGSSLGYNQTLYPEWKKSIEDHIDLAIKLHNIKYIYIIDHMKCGAFKKIYNKELTESEEYNLHIKNIYECINTLKEKYPNLEYKGFIMDISGKVNEV